MHCFQPFHVAYHGKLLQSVFHNEVSRELGDSAICYTLGKDQIRDISRVVGNYNYFLNTGKRNQFYGLGAGSQSQSQGPLFQRWQFMLLRETPERKSPAVCKGLVKTSTVLTKPPFNYDILLYFRVKFSHRCNNITDCFFNFSTFLNTVKYIFYISTTDSHSSVLSYTVYCATLPLASLTFFMAWQ